MFGLDSFEGNSDVSMAFEFYDCWRADDTVYVFCSRVVLGYTG